MILKFYRNWYDIQRIYCITVNGRNGDWEFRCWTPMTITGIDVKLLERCWNPIIKSVTHIGPLWWKKQFKSADGCTIDGCRCSKVSSSNADPGMRSSMPCQSSNRSKVTSPLEGHHNWRRCTPLCYFLTSPLLLIEKMFADIGLGLIPLSPSQSIAVPPLFVFWPHSCLNQIRQTDRFLSHKFNIEIRFQRKKLYDGKCSWDRWSDKIWCIYIYIHIII